MSYRAVFFVCACGLCLFVGCEKADLKPTEATKEDVTTNVSDTETADTLSVAEALYWAERCTAEELSTKMGAGVCGYIVGAIPGLMLSYAVFRPPFGTRTNLLIADDKNETDPSECLPVRLEKDTSFRTLLNLEDSPENAGRRILLKGTISNYFRTFGVYKLKEFAWCDDETSSADSSDISHFTFDVEITKSRKCSR